MSIRAPPARWIAIGPPPGDRPIGRKPGHVEAFGVCFFGALSRFVGGFAWFVADLAGASFANRLFRACFDGEPLRAWFVGEPLWVGFVGGLLPGAGFALLPASRLRHR